METRRRLVTDSVRSLIEARTPSRTTTDAVSTSEIRRFAQAIMDDNPVFYDPEAAARSRFSHIVAPGTFPLSCLRPTPFARDPMRDVSENEDTWANPVIEGLPQPPEWEGLYRFHAGDDLVLYQLASVCDQITANVHLKDIYEKKGRSGPMAFLTVHTDWTNQREELLCAHDLHTVWTEIGPTTHKPRRHVRRVSCTMPQAERTLLYHRDFDEVVTGQQLQPMIRRVTAPIVMRWCHRDLPP